MTNIEYIEIEKILPHPKNPRRDLGELEELTESIRKNGVLQNLTIVPADEGRYYCVIGHRRTEASKLAGLEKVPCIIKDMDKKTQVQTMLMENIQRSDLTPYEQAQGFQTMMDLGSSVMDIVKETGFSESTVRHRLKLTELDQDILQEKVEQNINMFDLVKLEQIRDQEDKKKALKDIGTNNFNYTLKNILEKQESLEKADIMRKRLEPYAKEITQEECKGVEFRFLRTWSTYMYSKEELENMDLSEYCIEDEPLYFTASQYGISLYKKSEAEPEQNEDPEQKTEWQEEREERLLKLREICKTMFQLRFDFAKYIPIKKAKEYLMTTLRRSGMMLALCETSWMADRILKSLIDFEEPEEVEEYDETEAWEAAIKKRLAQYPETTLFQIVYANLEEEAETFAGAGAYWKNNNLIEEYDFLTSYGYEMSDEEKQIVEGTHELYLKYATTN